MILIVSRDSISKVFKAFEVFYWGKDETEIFHNEVFRGIQFTNIFVTGFLQKGSSEKFISKEKRVKRDMGFTHFSRI